MTPEPTGRVFLEGHILVPADRIAQVRGALPDHIALTRAEPGCLSFEVTEDQDVEGRFNVREAFESQSAFEAHQARTKASPWFEVTEGIPREYAITTEID